MRIVVNDIAASKTGALAILLDFYNYVKDNCRQHEWIFLTGIDCLKECDNIRVILMDEVKKSQKNRLKFDLMTGSKFIESLKPDVVLSLQNTLTRGKIRNDGKKVPQVLYVHQPLGFQKMKRFSFLNPEEREYAVYQYLIGALIDASVKRADKVIVQTQWMKDAVAQKTGISLDRIKRVLPDVPDLSQYATDDIKDTFNCKNFFFPSGEILYKNHECVIKAAAILNNRGITDFNVRFTLKGLSDVTKRQYPDPYNNIVWTGRVPRDEVLSQYRNATLVFPSYIETFGFPLAEARQLGTVILASDTPFCREVLEGYENARFFNPFDEHELADLMEQVIKGHIYPQGGQSSSHEAIDQANNKKDSRDGERNAESYAQIVDVLEDVI